MPKFLVAHIPGPTYLGYGSEVIEAEDESAAAEAYIDSRGDVRDGRIYVAPMGEGVVTFVVHAETTRELIQQRR